MGKSCTCCGFTCPGCAICNRKIKSFDFKFFNNGSNGNPGKIYEENFLIDRPINQPCLKYFYVGDATGYYKQDGTRVAYKGYKMIITPTPGTQFSKDLIACNSAGGLDSLALWPNNDGIVFIEKTSNQIVITFPDERFFFEKEPVDRSSPVVFYYDDDKKMRFIFAPWNFQKFQDDLRNYESLDPSLIGKYPELKNCTIQLTSYNLQQGSSLNFVSVSGDLPCVANFDDYLFYSYYETTIFCSTARPDTNQLCYEDEWIEKELRRFTKPGYFYEKKHAKYEKIYHGFLVVINELECSCWANISESLYRYREQDLGWPTPPHRSVVITYSKCRPDPSCGDSSNIVYEPVSPCNIAYRRGTRLKSGIGEFSGDMSVTCPQCKYCFGHYYGVTGEWQSYFYRNQSQNYVATGYSSFHYSMAKSGFHISTPPLEVSESLPGACCCFSSGISGPTNSQIVRLDTYFDFAFSFLDPVDARGFAYSRCTNLSVSNEVQIILNFEDLNLNLNKDVEVEVNPQKNNSFNRIGKCLSELPGQFFLYTIGAIPVINGFELNVSNNNYKLKALTEFSLDNTPNQWAVDSSFFIPAENESGILECATESKEKNEEDDPLFFKDKRINKSIAWLGLSPDFNLISQARAPLTAGPFFSREYKTARALLFNGFSNSEFSETLEYRKVGSQAVRFLDRQYTFEVGKPPTDLQKLISDFSITVVPVFLTNLEKRPRGDFLPPMSRLKMYIEVKIIERPPIFKSYILKSNIIEINNPEDIYSTFTIDQEVGVFDGSILDPGGPRFIRDPFFSRPISVRLN